MKEKILSLLLIVSSLFGYLEWGQGNSAFLYESEYEVLRKLFTDPKSVIHPFVLLPLLGQILLLLTLFLQKPNRILTFSGIACLTVLLGLMFFIGILDLHMKILISTLPFIALVAYTIYYYRMKQKTGKIQT